MKIHIIYDDKFEGCSRILIEEFVNRFGYVLLDIGDLIRGHIRSGTILGAKMEEHLSKGEVLPDQLIHEILSNDIAKFKGRNVLLRQYPKTEGQIELFHEFCDKRNIKVQKIWYVKALNTMSNLEKVEKYKLMAEHAKSHESMRQAYEQTKKAIELTLERLNLKDRLEIVECESHGVDYENDKTRLKEKLHTTMHISHGGRVDD